MNKICDFLIHPGNALRVKYNSVQLLCKRYNRMMSNHKKLLEASALMQEDILNRMEVGFKRCAWIGSLFRVAANRPTGICHYCDGAETLHPRVAVAMQSSPQMCAGQRRPLQYLNYITYPGLSPSPTQPGPGGRRPGRATVASTLTATIE